MQRPPRRVGVFLAGVVLLSIPFWLLGPAARHGLMPGLPMSALMAFCPAAAALTLALADEGASGMAALAGRCLDLGRRAKPRWWLLAIAFMPAAKTVAFLAQRALGQDVPDPVFQPAVIGLNLLLFLAAAFGEELGWTGYAMGGLQARFGALTAALILGVLWGVWHIIPFLQAGRAWEWIGWQLLNAVAVRLIMVWLYCNAARSLPVVALFHAMDNVSWQAFPVSGSHYDPAVTGPIVAATALLIALTTSPATLQPRPRAPAPAGP